MKNEIDKIAFDIPISGTRVYGLLLVAYIKRKGKVAIHLAGITQMLFGIKGSRWEKYIVYPFKNLLNEYWK